MAGIEVSDRVLAETPKKAFEFVLGIRTCPGANAQLEAVGFDQTVKERFWELLHAAAGYKAKAPLLPASDAAVRSAFLELDNTDEPLCARIRAALDHHHPEQSAFVFKDLSPARGPAAVFVVSDLLDRLAELEQGRSDGTRDADKAAVATLEKRGITQKERARLTDLVNVAKQAASPQPTLSPTEAEAMRKAQLELHAWYTDWATTAKAVIRRRDYLIRLGLAKRRSKKDDEPAATEGPETAEVAEVIEP